MIQQAADDGGAVAAGGAQNAPARPGTDVAVNMDGFISVTPMRADLTCHASLRDLAAVLEDSPRETENQ